MTFDHCTHTFIFDLNWFEALSSLAYFRTKYSIQRYELCVTNAKLVQVAPPQRVVCFHCAIDCVAAAVDDGDFDVFFKFFILNSHKPHMWECREVFTDHLINVFHNLFHHCFTFIVEKYWIFIKVSTYFFFSSHTIHHCNFIIHKISTNKKTLWN